MTPRPASHSLAAAVPLNAGTFPSRSFESTAGTSRATNQCLQNHHQVVWTFLYHIPPLCSEMRSGSTDGLAYRANKAR